MLLETPRIALSSQFGIATAQLQSDVASRRLLYDLASALRIVARTPALTVLIVRGLTTQSEHGDSLWGQRCVRRLRGLPIPTLAYIDGPCLGPAWELALACHYRLTCAGANTLVGFPNPPRWGGNRELARYLGVRPAVAAIDARQTWTGGEAFRAGLIDRAFGPRLAPAMLQQFALELQAAPALPVRRWRLWNRLTSLIRLNGPVA